MKFLVCLCTILFLYACNTKTVDKERVDTIVVDSVPMVAEVIDEPRVPFDKSFYDDYSYKGIRIFEPTAYYKDSVSKKLFNIMDTIVGLFVDKGTYQLKKCVIEKVNTFEDECSGGAMIEPTLNVKDSCLYLFRGLNTKLKLGKVESMITNVITNHQNMIRISKYDNIDNVLIGDLDGDGIQDMIVKSSDNKEYVRITLSLSSIPKKGTFMQLVSSKFYKLGC